MTWRQGNCVRLTVEDTGVGITQQEMERLFDAFYTTKSDGMGMGLSVSRSIIENHSGRLWATRNDDHGARFSFSIPCVAKSSWSGGSFAFSLLDPRHSMKSSAACEDWLHSDGIMPQT
jgi:K+-sensing histidine kinase KdpD